MREMLQRTYRILFHFIKRMNVIRRVDFKIRVPGFSAGNSNKQTHQNAPLIYSFRYCKDKIVPVLN